MSTPVRRKGAVAGMVVTVTAAVAAAVGVVSTITEEAEAHGSTQVPASRVYSCRFEQPDNSMCSQASAADPQALYDWMEVNIGDAGGRHQELIPDGSLCSAGRDKYAAFDEPGEWPMTNLEPNSSGEHDIVFVNTAPHATEYYRLMLTKPGFDARTDRLQWGDLEEVYDSGPLPAAEQNHFSVALPARSEPAILYVIWQRSDSPEAFYSCSDVTIGGGSGGESPTTTTPSTTAPPDPSTTTSTKPKPPTTALPPDTEPPAPDDDANPPEPPSSTPDPDGDDTGMPGTGNPSSAVSGIEATATTTAEWGAGYCTEIQVANTTSSPSSWEVSYQPDGTIDTVWNAEPGDESNGSVAFTGEGWNESIAGGQSTTFGMCVSRE